MARLTSTPPREKAHRLPRYFYLGEVTVAFTARVAGAHPLFVDSEVVHAFLPLLRSAAADGLCLVLVYCFMPDHLHAVLRGVETRSDPRSAMVAFKQRTGFWLTNNRPGVRWQKDFYDHIIRKHEDLAAQMRYVANNPVRKALVDNWNDYPHTGAMGIDLQKVLSGLSTS